MYDYQRIEQAIRFIRVNFREQPDLDEIAREIHLSPFHFQRLFKEWAGVSPKKFLQFTSIEYAKKLLQEQKTLATVSFETGLSGTSRLHDMFVQIEGMTPGEYQNGGKNLHIHYSLAETLFGNILIASTEKGICHISFVEKKPDPPEADIIKRFPAATLEQKTDLHQQQTLKMFGDDLSDLDRIKLHLKGTPFQIKVWTALLQIPMGSLRTYLDIANEIGDANASRAVGTAIGTNPIAYLIPCHRVITSSGGLGGYHWGIDRKSAIIGWEAAHFSRVLRNPSGVPADFQGNPRRTPEEL
jgi:AraC family transcriptional regulator, regulatory protein of adaptative response / methylated-DNA-[protein]-cysteine methyltransferase